VTGVQTCALPIYLPCKSRRYRNGNFENRLDQSKSYIPEKVKIMYPGYVSGKHNRG
jgi:hypothetical protein